MALFVVRKGLRGDAYELFPDAEGNKAFSNPIYQKTVKESHIIPDDMGFEEAVRLYKLGVRPKGQKTRL